MSDLVAFVQETRDDQRSSTASPIYIYYSLKEVCGDSTVDRSTVSRRATRFLDGRTSIKDDQRSGRPSLSTDETSVIIEWYAQRLTITCEEITTELGFL